jgi:hypothetical protein
MNKIVNLDNEKFLVENIHYKNHDEIINMLSTDDMHLLKLRKTLSKDIVVFKQTLVYRGITMDLKINEIIEFTFDEIVSFDYLKDCNPFYSLVITNDYFTRRVNSYQGDGLTVSYLCKNDSDSFYPKRNFIGRDKLITNMQNEIDEMINKMKCYIGSGLNF